jgi:8-oxo-dGTP diphosphatase
VASLAAVDFDRFRPDDVATLCFIRDGDRVLLIEKLRGHGAGKVNAPGGKLEPGESARSCARRETHEEVGVDVSELECRAELRFQDSNGYAMRGFAFVAERATGEPRQTVEAVPFWCPIDALPFERMWEDDRLWLPRVLDGESIVGEFLFDRERLVEHRLRTIDADSLAARADARAIE